MAMDSIALGTDGVVAVELAIGVLGTDGGGIRESDAATHTHARV